MASTADSKPLSIADRLASLILFCIATSLFVPLSYWLSVPLATLTSALVLALSTYLALNIRLLRIILTRKIVIAIAVLIFGWPLLSALYSIAFDPRDVQYPLVLLVVFISSLTYAYKNGRGVCTSFLRLALLVASAGVALSYYWAEPFNAAWVVSQVKAEYVGRGRGFALQPNVSAMVIVVLYSALLSLRALRSWREAGVLAVAAGTAVILTGSRGAMIAYSVATVAYGAAWALRYRRGTSFPAFVAVSQRIVVAMSALFLGAMAYSGAVTIVDEGTIGRWNLFSQLERMLAGTDSSVANRLGGQADYWYFIQKRPLVGYGVGANQYLQEIGAVRTASHNQLIEDALRYGLPYSLFAMSILFRLTILAPRAGAASLLGAPLAASLLIEMLVSNVVLTSREVWIVLGIFLALSRGGRWKNQEQAPEREISRPA